MFHFIFNAKIRFLFHFSLFINKKNNILDNLFVNITELDI